MSLMCIHMPYATEEKFQARWVYSLQLTNLISIHEAKIMDIFWNYTKLFYFMKFSLLYQVKRVHKTVLPGLSLIFRAAVANKDSPVTSPQNLVSPLASHFDHP